jgi:hypothetical protein
VDHSGIVHIVLGCRVTAERADTAHETGQFVQVPLPPAS